MFRFAMDLTDAIEHGGFACRYGIAEDREFSRRRIDAFRRKYPDFVPHRNGARTAADIEYDAFENEMVFRWDSESPRCISEAVELVREAFFFPPVRVWLDGEEFGIATCRLGEVVARYG